MLEASLYGLYFLMNSGHQCVLVSATIIKFDLFYRLSCYKSSEIFCDKHFIVERYWIINRYLECQKKAFLEKKMHFKKWSVQVFQVIFKLSLIQLYNSRHELAKLHIQVTFQKYCHLFSFFKFFQNVWAHLFGVFACSYITPHDYRDQCYKMDQTCNFKAKNVILHKSWIFRACSCLTSYIFSFYSILWPLDLKEMYGYLSSN